MTMKRRTKAASRIQSSSPTLQDLVAAVHSVADNDKISAIVVADLINSGRVRLRGDYRNRRVVVV